ncbi:hypothetical protein RchiOBHm_Chr2g0130251 [Rosa chinensis]|uniref:Uncharacterized protein n=1 Tax=Rosa chinensis TaxID=74649 RepID=A0A2P6RUS5_ROSCH|nr:hypothetical protein RchiOBHm_Chr2g0130251 [Rosa chinensis]
MILTISQFLGLHFSVEGSNSSLLLGDSSLEKFVFDFWVQLR